MHTLTSLVLLQKKKQADALTCFILTSPEENWEGVISVIADGYTETLEIPLCFLWPRGIKDNGRRKGDSISNQKGSKPPTKEKKDISAISSEVNSDTLEPS